MPLYTKPTPAALRAAVRRELADPNAKWWADAEINSSLQSWLDDIQGTHELLWGTATLAVGTATSSITLGSVATDILRPERALWTDSQVAKQRLPVRSKGELDLLFRYWPYLNVGTPKVASYNDSSDLLLVPAPARVGTLTIEYPRKLTLAEGVPVPLPGWCRFSAVPFVCWKALLRPGPNNNLGRAARYKALYLRALERIGGMKAKFLPSRYPQLTPGGQYEASILNPSLAGAFTLPGPVTRADMEELTITGTIDGDNTVFTLSQAPMLAMIYRNGVLQEPTDHYTLAGATVTFVRPYQPQSGDSLYAVGSVA